MPRHRSFVLVIFLSMWWFHSPGWAQGEKADTTRGFLTLPEILKILTESKTIYNILPLDSTDIPREKFLEVYYPEVRPHTEYPWIEIRGDSSIILREYECGEDAWEAIKVAEEHFFKKEYSRALEHYERAMAASESCYVAYLLAGDCYLMVDQPERALDYYLRAKKLNPYDYRVYFFSATAHMKLGQPDLAVENYIRALTFKPRHKNILEPLSSIQQELGIKIYDNSLHPAAVVQKGKDGAINIYVSLKKEDRMWMAFAMAKALYLGEPDFGGGKEDSPRVFWTSREEKQAIFSLMETYLSMRENNEIPPVPELDRLKKIIQDGYLEEYILYELASRMVPDVVLQSGPLVWKRVEAYIRKYVVVQEKSP
ncbi:MAG: tetratricopeptide repeat protein [Calditrichaeota bacterium]|nr:MAG: tetratricopeptide repeat protein [Calditrichota bacterium]